MSPCATGVQGPASDDRFVGVLRDVVGENSVLGDVRWAGAWGIQADFIAKTPCSIMCIDKQEVLVRDCL